jgi:hypothetical protein
MDGAKAFNLLGGAVLILVLGYFASTRLGGPGGPEIGRPTGLHSQADGADELHARASRFLCRLVRPVQSDVAGSRPIRKQKPQRDRDAGECR